MLPLHSVIKSQTLTKMSINEVRDEIKRRQALAESAHKHEINSECPNIRTKEQAWGKLVAYNKCLELLSLIKSKH